MAAYKAAGFDEANLTAIGFGFEGIVGQTALMDNSSYRAALGMFPDFVGVSLVDAAVKLHAGEVLPDHYETPTIMVTRANVDHFYDKAVKPFAMKLDAVRGLLQ